MIWDKKKENGFTDAELVEGCISGKSKYQELLYRRFFSFAMSICIRYTPSSEEAMEVVNDSFVKVFENLGSYDKLKPFNSWFAKIVVNTSIDSYRRNLRHSNTLSISSIPETEKLEPDIDQELSAEDILKLFADLPENYRVVFNLYEVEGYSHEEIGEMLGIAPSTSRANLTRAKQQLRELYKKHFNPVKNCHEAL